MMKNTLYGLIGAAIVLGLLFFLWPGYTTTLAIGVVGGVLLGNLVPKIEAWAEGAIAKIRG